MVCSYSQKPRGKGQPLLLEGVSVSNTSSLLYFPNILVGGHWNQICVMSTVIFIPNAPIVLKAGQVPQKRTRPRIDTIAVPTESGRHNSTGTSTPRKPSKEARKPIAANIQKILLIIRKLCSPRLGNNHDRAGIQKPNRWPVPCTNNAPAIRILIICVDILTSKVIFVILSTNCHK